MFDIISQFSLPEQFKIKAEILSAKGDLSWGTYYFVWFNNLSNVIDDELVAFDKSAYWENMFDNETKDWKLVQKPQFRKKEEETVCLGKFFSGVTELCLKEVLPYDVLSLGRVKWQPKF